MLTQANDCLPGTEDRREEPDPTKWNPKHYKWECSGPSQLLHYKCQIFSAVLQLTDRRSSEKILQPIPEVLWQQLPETSVETSKLGIIDDNLTFETTRNTQMPDSGQRTDVQSQTSILKVTSRQENGPIWNPSEKTTRGVNQYRASSAPKTIDPKNNKQLTTSQPFVMDLIVFLLSQKQLHR